MNQPYIPNVDYNEPEPEEWDLSGLPETEVTCPKDGTRMLLYPQGTSPDGYTNTLICSQCKYTETD